MQILVGWGVGGPSPKPNCINICINKYGVGGGISFDYRFRTTRGNAASAPAWAP